MTRAPRIEARDAMLLAGLRRRHTFADMSATISRQWHDFRTAGEVDGRVGASEYGAICSAEAAGIEYLTGVEVATFGRLPAELGRMRVPAQRYAVFAHPGPVTTLADTWQWIWSGWLPDSDYVDAHTPPFEHYGADFDPETGRGTIEIWFPIAPKRPRPAAT